jgi:ATP-dependent Clp protease ATP-binding subunit ClpC
MTTDDPRIDAILSLTGSDRATDRSRTSIQLAVESADEFSNTHVDSCHILCGLLREGQGVAAHILRSQFDVTRASMDLAMVTRDCFPEPTDSKIAPDVKLVMDSTVDFARRLNHSYFGTEHLLAGVLTPDTRSMILLDKMGISVSGVEREILGLLGHLT